LLRRARGWCRRHRLGRRRRRGDARWRRCSRGRWRWGCRRRCRRTAAGARLGLWQWSGSRRRGHWKSPHLLPGAQKFALLLGVHRAALLRVSDLSLQGQHEHEQD
jgi:hypothetical protein